MTFHAAVNEIVVKEGFLLQSKASGTSLNEANCSSVAGFFNLF
jgi:hypothetical protein